MSVNDQNNTEINFEQSTIVKTIKLNHISIEDYFYLRVNESSFTIYIIGKTIHTLHIHIFCFLISIDKQRIYVYTIVVVVVRLNFKSLFKR